MHLGARQYICFGRPSSESSPAGLTQRHRNLHVLYSNNRWMSLSQIILVQAVIGRYSSASSFAPPQSSSGRQCPNHESGRDQAEAAWSRRPVQDLPEAASGQGHVSADGTLRPRVPLSLPGAAPRRGKRVSKLSRRGEAPSNAFDCKQGFWNEDSRPRFWNSFNMQLAQTQIGFSLFGLSLQL